MSALDCSKKKAAAHYVDMAELARLQDVNVTLLAVLEEIEQLWAFSPDFIDERAEFDKAWLERARAAIAKARA